jgi:transposase-like protein
VQVNIKNLIDDVQCYQTVRELRWPDGVVCPSCESKYVIKRGFDDTEPARQRYECHDCNKRFDDLTDTIFAGHHQPLKVWVLCLYFMGLNLSNEQIAHELSHIPPDLVVTLRSSHNTRAISTGYLHDVSSAPTATPWEMRHGTGRQSTSPKPHPHRRFPR